MAVVAILVPLLALSFGLRLAAVPLLRKRNLEAASFVERYWTWLPLVFAVGLFAVFAWPLAVILVVAVAVGIVVQPSAFGLRSNRS